MSKINKRLICPVCSFSLKKSNSFSLKCTNENCSFAKNGFKIVNNIPVVIPFLKSDCIFDDKTFNKSQNLGYKKRYRNKLILFIKKIKKIIEGNSLKSNLNFKFLTNYLSKSSKILIIGGGSKGSGMDQFYNYCKTNKIQIASLDVYISKDVTVVADAHYLPFPDSSFNIVIIQAVLEHVLNPQKVVKEINRVLKNKGIIYSETPFLQSVHEGPFDFSRFTHSGHRWLFKDFKEIKSGSLNGAFSSCLFILSYTFSALLRNRLLGILIRVIFRRIVTFLDKCIPEKYNIDLSCGCYFIGEKNSKYKYPIKAKDMKIYYSGSQ